MSASIGVVATISPLTVKTAGTAVAFKARALSTYTPTAGDAVAFEPLSAGDGVGYVLILGKLT